MATVVLTNPPAVEGNFLPPLVTQQVSHRTTGVPPLRSQISLDEVAPSAYCLTLDRKETRNALSMQMVAELRAGIARVAATPSARVLLIRSAHEGVFCAGADLKERAEMSSEEVSRFLDDIGIMLRELEALAIPTIAVVDGIALGGGCELCFACDMRFGGPNTIMALPEVKLGIIPGAGGTQRLTRLLGTARSKELIFSGRSVEITEADRIGLLNSSMLGSGSAWDKAMSCTRQILAAAPLAVRASKLAIQASDMAAEGLNIERELYDSLLLTKDRQEGLLAFKEKRQPVFVGM